MGSSEKKSGASRQEDVLVKVIRVIANISMNTEIGPSIAENESCILLLIEILGECRVVLMLVLVLV